MHKSLNIIFAFLVVACFFTLLHAQENNTEFQLRLAQSFEQTGEWEQSVLLFEKLYRAEPTNDVYFEGLQRGYLHLREYDEAIRLVDQRLQTRPINIGLLTSLGGIYFESGSEQKADSVWSRVIAIDPKNVGLYRVVASQMMDHRLFPQAISTYLAGRKTTGDDNAFADDLATLYTALQQYEAASTEFIRLLIAYPQQLPFIENRIASFTIRDAGLRAATSVTRDMVNKTPDNITLRKLYAWLAMEDKDYQTALGEYRTMDRLSGSNGAELLDFGRRASQEGNNLSASEAFQDIISHSQNPVIVAQARYGYARSMEDLCTEADSAMTPEGIYALQEVDTSQARVSETEKGFQRAIRLYEANINDYPNSELAAQSFYRIGIIRMERFADFNGSIDSFRKARTTTRTIELAGDASRKTAEVYVLQNDLMSARSEYQRILQMPLPAYHQLAQFGMAELDYFGGEIDSSLAELKSITGNLGSDMSNNGLMLQYFILENKETFPAALKEYALADLLMRQQRYSEALASFTDVVRAYPTALLVDDATMKIAELKMKLGRVPEGLSTFQHVINDMPESILRDRAQMRIAETYQYILKDKEKAIAAYEQILAKFPNSLYMEQARKRIRQLRGDAS